MSTIPLLRLTQTIIIDNISRKNFPDHVSSLLDFQCVQPYLGHTKNMLPSTAGGASASYELVINVGL